MPHGQGTHGGRRDAFERNEQQYREEGRRQRAAGGRSESYAAQRDVEQRRAGYARGDWERGNESYRTVHSEPDWDPNRFAHGQRGFGYDAHPSSPRDEERRARYGYDDGYDLDQRRIRSVAGGGRLDYESDELGRGFPGGRRSAGDFDRTYHEHEHERSLSGQIGDAGRRLIGKIKRVVRNPKNYTRSDERIREDVCDQLSLSEEVDPREIEVSVTAGEVTLTGTVETRQMKFVAEEIADDVAGVHDVHNQLRVQRLAQAPGQNTGNVSINSQEPARGSKNIGRS